MPQQKLWQKLQLRDDSSGQKHVCSNHLDDVAELQVLRGGHLDPEAGNCCIRSEVQGDQVRDQEVRAQGGLQVPDTRGSCHQSYQ